MARIPMTSGFVIIPEGEYVFRIYDATYDEDFGRIEIKLVNAQGATHTERFSIKDKNDEYNEKALNAFSYFAKTAMNDYTMEDIDPEQLINHYIRADVVHTKVPSNKDPNKEVTFANLGDKSPADGFDTEPVARALTLGNGINEYQTEALRTAAGMNHPNNDEILLNGVMGLCGESGECVDMVKKYRFQGHELDKAHLAKELGDVAWYLAVTAHAIGYDLETVLQMNVDKLRNRYPNGFEKERSLHRQEGDV